ncbi:MAG: hypothetical protein J5502_09265, partial [Prevotella sp.]|nr:hypothetical protein [Prevotella sp.]
FQRKVNILAVFLNSYNGSKLLYYSRKHIYSLFTNHYSLKKRVRADDLVKTPVSHDMGALRRCNPPAS